MQRNPITRKGFNPSYDFDNQAAYLEKANACNALYQQALKTGDWTAYDENGCKRRLHMMIQGGRQGVRFPDEPITPAMPQTMRRLALDEAPWRTRTQAPTNREWVTARQNPSPKYKAKKKRELKESIATAIKAFQAATGQPSDRFTVPNQAASLIGYGMPWTAAHLLVDRAGGKTFHAASVLVEAPNFPKLFASLNREFGAAIHLQKDRLVLLRARGVLSDEARRLPQFDFIKVGGQTVLTPEQVSFALDKFKSSLKYDYIYEEDGPTFLNMLFFKLQHEMDALGAPVEVVVRFHDTKGPIERSFTYGEHSKKRRGEATHDEVDYRSLRGVTLDALPQILTNISKRRPTRENPMARNNDKYFLEQYSSGPYGARRSIPASRRNPWYADDLWLPDTTTVRSALVPAEHPWSDLTEVRSALVPGPYALSNPRKGRKSRRNGSHQATQAMHLLHSGRAPTLKAAWRMVKKNPRTGDSRYSSYQSDMQWEQRDGWFSQNEHTLDGRVPVNRRNPHGGVHFTKNGQPYVVEIVNGRKRARFISKGAAARPNMAGRPGAWGLPTRKIGKSEKARAMVLLGSEDLKALAAAGDKHAAKELADRAAARQARAGKTVKARGKLKGIEGWSAGSEAATAHRAALAALREEHYGQVTKRPKAKKKSKAKKNTWR